MDGFSLDNIWRVLLSEVGSAKMKSSCKQQIRVWRGKFLCAFKYCNIWLLPESKAACVNMCLIEKRGEALVSLKPLQ